MLNPNLLWRVFLPSQDAHHSGIHFAPLGKYFLLFDGQRLEKDDYAVELHNNFSSTLLFKAVYLTAVVCIVGLVFFCFPQWKHSPVSPKGKRTRMLQIQGHRGVKKIMIEEFNRLYHKLLATVFLGTHIQVHAILLR